MFGDVALVLEIIVFMVALGWVFHKRPDKFKVSEDIWGEYQNHPAIDEEDLPVITFSEKSTDVTVTNLSHHTLEE